MLSSEAAAEVAVRNPFAFPLKIAETQYTIFVEGREVGDGATQGMILHPGQKNVLVLPIELDNAGLISVAGKALMSGGDVAARLRGRLVIRLKGGDLTVPLALSGHLSGRLDEPGRVCEPAPGEGRRRGAHRAGAGRRAQRLRRRPHRRAHARLRRAPGRTRRFASSSFRATGRPSARAPTSRGCAGPEATRSPRTRRMRSGWPGCCGRSMRVPGR